MAKKKGKRRMKKQVRKTLGALFLASAVAVAAIPTGSYDGGQASAGITNNEEGVPIYTHVVLPDWRLGGDSANHTESYPIKSNTQADGTVSIKSIYVDSQKLGTSTDPNAILESTRIPLCKDDTTIYSTSDAYYRFAYVDSNGDQNGDGIKSAVILAYTNESSLDGGRLEIPETVDAYLNLNDNNGTTTGLTAVGKSGNYLFYQTDEETEYYTLTYSTVTVQMRDATNNLLFWISYDGGLSYGTATYTQAQINALKAAEAAKPETERREILSTPAITEEKAAVRTYYAPCTATKFSTWEGKDLYYYPTSDYKATGTPRSNATYDEADESGNKRVVPQLANTQAYERIANAPVYYIGNQYLDAASKIAGTITSANQGVFANNGNIGTLVISSNLVGIGDYAFYGCSVKNIEFDNGLNTIGNHAFDNCTKLTTVSIPSESNISTIGAYAFKNCQSLTGFEVPTTVRSIGDGAFKNCWSLSNIEMNLSGNRLSNLGAYVFQNCEALESLTFPRGYTETIELSEFEGCKSLQYVKSESSVFNIVASTTCDFDWDAFKAEFNGGENADIETRNKFYIEAANSSPLHATCTENEMSFKYLNDDLYELTKNETSISGQTGRVTYQMNGRGVLTDTNFDGPVTSIEFPKYIGPNSIRKIGDSAFQDKCTLTEVRIGSGIQEIGVSAFQGCHNLKYVYFDTDTVQIDTDAFLTQKVTNHAKSCTAYNGADTDGDAVTLCSGATMTDADNNPAIKLHFVGTVGAGSTPYAYAMSYNGRYSDSNQKLSFVDFLSGWPTMLTIQYHYDTATGTGYSELVDFPTNKDLDQYYNAEYLTDKQRAAAKAVLTTPEENRTEDQEVFYNASLSLTIPDGVDAILDGLYVKKTVGLTAFPVTCYGLKSIETNYKKDDAGNVLYFADETDLIGTTAPDPARNYFPRADQDNSDFAGASALNEIHIYGGVDQIAPYAFQNDTNLTTVDIPGTVSEIGEHAFQGDSRLESVYISDGLISLGVAPFKGCTSLDGENLSFGGNENYTCDNSIIYRTSGGKKTGIIEVLPGRSNSIRKAELGAEIESVAEEAFTTAKVKIVDLSGTSITTIPKHAFYEANGDGGSVALPDTCTTVESYAFEKSRISEISARNVLFPEAPMLDGIIVNGGQTDSVDTSRNSQVTVYAPEDSYMYKYAVAYKYTADPDISKAEYTVNFYGYNEETDKVDTLVYNTTVEDGANLLASEIGLAEYSAVSNYKDSLGYYHVLEGWQDDNRAIYTDAQLVERAITGDTNFYGNYVVRVGQSYTVSFNDYNEKVIKSYTITEGNTLAQEEKEPPVLSDVTADGIVYEHTGWKKSGELSVTDPITRDVTFDPIYVKKETGLYTVTFNYIDPTTSKMLNWTQQSNVPAGTDLSKSVSAPAVDGYTFNGWDNATATPNSGDITNVNCDFMLVGTFTSNSGSGNSGSTDTSSNTDGSSSTTTKPSGGSNDTVQINGFTIPAYDTKIFAVALYYDANGNPYSYRLVNIGSKAPDVTKPEGYTSGYAWSPTPTETTVNDVSFFNLVPYTPSSNSGSSSSGTTGKFYTLTVVNGSGSGSYNEDSTVIIVANDPASGQEFSNWTIEPSGTKIASKAMSATTITMPGESVTVKAHYKAKTTSSTVSGNSTNNSSGKTSNTGTVSNGTTVVIDKNGLSNTGVVSATVKGSSDNFTIKIKESSEASAAVVKALQAEYGDISGIKYFPMDISLYDATGTKKITDTTGLTVNITLPLPDSLIPYAGNNKVAGVVNNKLDKLTPKFTTIDKVACITFTAEHFSPYVIYVDTNNATAGGQIIADNTPKTGDGIHPKWFLSLGLACVSAVLFLKRDKKSARVTTA